MITLLGGGPICAAALRDSLAVAPSVVAADGGAQAALDAGVDVLAVIGDFDSINAASREAIAADRLHPSSDQDTTDFEKALAAVNAPLILGVGFMGGRVDHTLAVMSALTQYQRSPVVLLGEEDLCFALNHAVELELEVGARVSLYPIARVRCRSTGLRWATNDLTFDPLGRIGTSNEAASRKVTLEADGPGLLVILPRSTLPVVLPALLGSYDARAG